MQLLPYIVGYFRGTKFSQITQTKHFEDKGSIDRTPTVEWFNTGCKPIFEALNFRVSESILENLENNQLYGIYILIFTFRLSAILHCGVLLSPAYQNSALYPVSSHTHYNTSS